MITKRILVLANSTKHYPKSCVAGRELAADGSGKNRWGDWIRPVSNHDEGALDFGERRLADGKDPKPLDIVRLSLSHSENNPLQPENWLIQAGQTWTKESTLETQTLLSLVEQPENLWLDSGQKSDRVSANVLHGLQNFQSLYLIRPAGFYFQIHSKLGMAIPRSNNAAYLIIEADTTILLSPIH
ncbi:MAG: hypothetical protein WDM76_09165 [Limisphaerales bacterium]